MKDIILTLFNFLNNNSGIATLIAGAAAFLVYIAQRRDYKRDVASLILQEIRYAEQQIRSSRDFSQNAENYPLSIKLLPTNSWYKNIHLFMGDFKQPQIDAISRFYAQVEYIDLVIQKISDYKIALIEQEVSDTTGKIILREDILPERVSLYGILNSLAQRSQKEEAVLGSPQTSSGVTAPQNSQPPSFVNLTRRLKASSILKEVSSKVEFIENTPIGEKFKTIASQKWFWLL